MSKKRKRKAKKGKEEKKSQGRVYWIRTIETSDDIVFYLSSFFPPFFLLVCMISTHDHTLRLRCIPQYKPMNTYTHQLHGV